MFDLELENYWKYVMTEKAFSLENVFSVIIQCLISITIYWKLTNTACGEIHY